MHLKVFLKLKNPKSSSGQIYKKIQKPKKLKKKPKTQKTHKKTTELG
jgi:hypothetical protein